MAEQETSGVTIKKMPTKKMLEAFMQGFHGNATVLFNRETGVFEWSKEFEPQNATQKPEVRKKVSP